MVSYNYDIYSESAVSVKADNTYAFNSEYTNALTGIQYLGVIYYDPRAGIFLTEDIQNMAVMPDI